MNSYINSVYNSMISNINASLDVPIKFTQVSSRTTSVATSNNTDEVVT